MSFFFTNFAADFKNADLQWGITICDTLKLKINYRET